MACLSWGTGCLCCHAGGVGVMSQGVSVALFGRLTMEPLHSLHLIILYVMAKFNFDEIVDRRGSDCVKWDETDVDGMLPMWVADMDFRTAPAIIEALQRRAAHGVFGYEHVPQSYYAAVVGWFARRHGWTFRPGWIIYTTGVVPAVSAVIKAVTVPGDKVLVQTPVYNCFFSSIRNNGCIIEENKLVYSNGTYSVDFEDFERRVADPSVKAFLLCNPHNPAGRVWTPDELRRMGEICLRHGVFVIADEIHCDIVMPGYKYTPFASLSDEFLANSATCTAPTKTFNIAGLQIANIIAADDTVRKKIDRAININEVCDVGPFGVVALQAAYNESEGWLDELLPYIKSNYDYLCDFFAAHMPMLKVLRLEGTYLVWVDCTALGRTSSGIISELKDGEKLWLNGGDIYGETDRPFVRINIACPRATLVDGLNRLLHYVERIVK